MAMTAMNLADRYLRQREIVPPERLATCKATVVGVGAIGRQVALQLAAMGVPWLQLVDPDIVEPVNLACQGYLENDLGRTKVSATADMCQQINHALAVQEIANRFHRSLGVGNVLFCCVDSIATRRLIWEAVRDRIDFWADGRMSAEVLRILVAADGASRRRYPSTLFSPERAFTGSCTAKSTIFCANIAAGLMVAQFAKFLRNLPIEADLQLNLLSGELAVAPGR